MEKENSQSIDTWEDMSKRLLTIYTYEVCKDKPDPERVEQFRKKIIEIATILDDTHRRLEKKVVGIK
tara:strand:+ start:2438 stop:2638 length:201 start_codon:yes stop_codon:yes gene_type:complete